MKKATFLFITLFCISNYCISQNNITVSTGESTVHKKSDNGKALNEAINDAQRNAVIAYGGYINVLTTYKKEEEITESKKGAKGKENKTSDSFTSNYRSSIQNAISAMILNIEIKADTVWLNKSKYKVIVNGKFEVNLKDIGNYITDYLNETEQKIKIEVKENDCFGKIYKPMSEYINSKKSNFFFSNQPWLAGEGDYKIEINSNRAVLFDKRFSPNVVIKIYSYKNCYSLIDNLDIGNNLLDEMIKDIYAVYLYKSIK
ncbi:MAG: hypothetical protein EHM93_18885 [Bacteroidales bacterium]|nr:MAG: hypothetical protein EHM93_18885 [Bacteroidales bacterium]